MRAIIGGMKTTITYALLVALLFSAFAPDAARARERGIAARRILVEPNAAQLAEMRMDAACVATGLLHGQVFFG